MLNSIRYHTFLNSLFLIWFDISSCVDKFHSKKLSKEKLLFCWALVYSFVKWKMCGIIIFSVNMTFSPKCKCQFDKGKCALQSEFPLANISMSLFQIISKYAWSEYNAIGAQIKTKSNIQVENTFRSRLPDLRIHFDSNSTLFSRQPSDNIYSDKRKYKVFIWDYVY